MKTSETRKTRTNGLVVQADDLQIGGFYAVVGLKRDKNRPVPISGQAFKVKAIDFPFMIGKLVSDPGNPPITFDVRYLSFMRVSLEYVQAQQPQQQTQD